MFNKKRVTKFDQKTNGLINFFDLKKPQFKILYWSIYAFMFLMSIICLVPTIWVAVSGFKTMQEMNAVSQTFFPKHFDFSRIPKVINQVNVMKYLYNSIMLIIGCWACDITINGLAGYVLSRIKPIGSKFIDRAIFWTMLLPGISMVPLYITFMDVPGLHINLSGSYLPIWVMAGTNAFNIFLFKSFFNGIPMSYLEAAKIDGCTDLGIFGKIILPLSKPIIMVVTIFSITGTWANFMWPYLILGSTDKEPIAVMLYKFSQSGAAKNDYMILIMLSIIPMIIMYSIFSKHIMGGLNMSGIKG